MQGLSTLLEGCMGLSLRPERLTPGEAWAPDITRIGVWDLNPGCTGDQDSIGASQPLPWPQSQAQPRTEAAGGQQQRRVGVLYVALDPDCTMPFTVMVRGPAAEYSPLGSSPSSSGAQQQGGAGLSLAQAQQMGSGGKGEGDVPRVAIHLAARQLRGSGSGTLARDPSLVSAIRSNNV